MPRVRVIFSRKNSEKGMSIFHKNSGKAIIFVRIPDRVSYFDDTNDKPKED